MYKPNIAVMIPCLNEELTIATVVRDFQAQLPEATVYVFDNGSTDRTAEEAARAGAVVITQMRRGKGFVVQSMFQDIEADVYVMVDGDNTYPAGFVHELMQPVLNGTADMAVGARLDAAGTQFRLLNRLGNKFFLGLVNLFLRTRLTDILSGYRVMNRAFIKSIPLLAGGFEIETELTIKAVQRRFRIVEVPTPLKSRPPGSASKIKIAQDGLRILGTILSLVRDYKPLTVFGSLGLLLILIGSSLGLCCLWEPQQLLSGWHLGYGVLALVSLLCGPLSIGIGLVLHVVNRHFLELESLYTHNHSLAPGQQGKFVRFPLGAARESMKKAG
jgi:glycosyltransferase involved in cell wall biosynthesis